MVATVSKDTPLSEIVLRKYEKPHSLAKRDLVKKICLSLGLLQPGDSRDIIVDILFVFLNSKNKKPYSISQIQNLVMGIRKQFKQPLHGVAESNIRRQIRRLRELYIIEKVNTKYMITERANLTEIFNEKIQNFILSSIVSRIKDYVEEVDKRFQL